jgi:hypothetical protein
MSSDGNLVFKSIPVICTLTGKDCHTSFCSECKKTWKISIPKSLPNNKVHLEMSAWVEDGEEYSNIPRVCPVCKGRLVKVDALSLCNTLFVYCKGSLSKGSCWCENYYL